MLYHKNLYNFKKKMFSAEGTHFKYTITEQIHSRNKGIFFLQKYLVNICSSNVLVYSFVIILQGQIFSNIHS